MSESGDGAGRASDPVDWATARRVARFVAGRDPLADSYLAASLQTDFDVLTVRAEDLVAGYTGLRVPDHASARVLDRRDWVESNISSMRSLLDPLMQRFGARMAHNPLSGTAYAFTFASTCGRGWSGRAARRLPHRWFG